MGGRGIQARPGLHQTTLLEVERQSAIANIIEERKLQITQEGSAGVGGVQSPRLLKKCACCGEYTLMAGTNYEECSICGWIDDPLQNQNPNSNSGKNAISLTEARLLYQS